MTIDDLVQKIVTDLVASSAIKTYCTTNLGGAHAVHQGKRGAQSPATYPAINVMPLSKTRGDLQQSWTYAIAVEVALEDSTVTTTTVSGVTKSLQDGPTRVEALLDLIWTAISAITFTGPTVDWTDQEYTIGDEEEGDYFPIFTGRLVLTASFTRLIGASDPVIVT
ncbi:MAG TPA: hypothetical protein PKM59_03785 [Thermodesulfobacteriota bacterium]|nr:hypothetical protein [Thermodesulfobacteriota bacterium]